MSNFWGFYLQFSPPYLRSYFDVNCESKITIMNQSKLIILTLISCFLFCCSKYEDGPVISLRTKKARLTGTWEIAKINGTAPASGEQWEFEFEKDGDYTEVRTSIDSVFVGYNYEYVEWYNYPLYDIQILNTSTNGEWEFFEDGADLYLKHENGGYYYGINRLTMNELTLESFDYYNDSLQWIEYEFEKD